MIVATFLGSVIFWFLNLQRSKRITKLEDQISELSEERDVLADNVRALIDGYLVRLAFGRLNFGERTDCSDRITLYSHDPTAKEFVLIGRFSANPFYRDVRRSTYPDNEGCMAKAWENGYAFIDDLPNPIESAAEYVAQQAESGRFSEEATRELRMKSRLYYAYRIMDTRSLTPIAVVVVESTAAGRFERPNLDEVFNNKERLFMSDLLEALQKHLLVPSDALKAGF